TLVPMQLSLLVLWVLLWGELSWTNLATGMVVAIAIPALFYLPPIESTGRFHLGWSIWFMLRLLFDNVRASVVVAGQAVGIRYSRNVAIIGVRLRTRNDLILTATAEAVTLVPGAIVIDADREHGELFLHVFSVRSPDDIEKARRAVLVTEARLIRAFGSSRSMQRLKAEGAATGATKGERTR
ncbi:MAG: Na+/H+ antiporter subunit E, partial [Demequina sp.]